MKKERIYELDECAGFDAYSVIERWEVGNKWYEKRTTAYIHHGTIGEDFVTVEWSVMDFDSCKKLWMKEDVMHDNFMYSGMGWNRKYQHVG